MKLQNTLVDVILIIRLSGLHFYVAISFSYSNPSVTTDIAVQPLVMVPYFVELMNGRYRKCVLNLSKLFVGNSAQRAVRY